MENIEKLAHEMGEITDNFGLHFSTLEGANELLSDVLEDFTNDSMTAEPYKRDQQTRGKLQTLITLIDYLLCDINKTLDDATKNNLDVLKYVRSQKEQEELENDK